MRISRTLPAVYLLCAAISAASLVTPVEAQIDFKLKTTAGSAAVLERYYYNRGVQNDCVRGVLDGCVAPVNSSQVVNWTGEFSGRADVNSTAQALSVSGDMQHSGVNKENKYGEAASNYMVQVFADVPPGAGVKIIFRHSVSTTWNIPVNGGYGQAAWSFYPYGQPLPSVGGGVSVNRAIPSGAPLEVSVSMVETTARAPSPYIENGGVLLDGGKTYYYIGYFDISGGMWMEREIPAGESGSYSSSIDNIEVRHIGKVLKKLPEGDAQTGLVTKPLPKGLNVRVINDDTGIPVANEPVTFTVAAPGHNASLSATPVTDLNGYATAYLTLGTSTGTYTVRATCPGCLPYVNTVNFSETGVGTELTCVSCEWHGTAGEELRNPFRLRVVNTATGEPVAGAAVTYTVIRFTDKNGNTSSNVHGADRRVFNAVTDIYGFSRAYLDLGSEEGTYVVQARCETCLGGQEQIARGIAHNYDITPEVERVIAGDPGANGGDCPSGCCPVTPVLRMKMITAPNDGVSFTSDNAENLIGLSVNLLPACLKESTNVTWQVADAPGDFINSGTPAQPTPGEVSSFRVFNSILPVEASGRALPLAYKVTASITRDGITNYANATVKQDEIDKCRQEYIDFGIGLGEVVRSRFTLGLDGEFVGRPLDCYAHIYPSRAGEVQNLRATSTIRVNSGYRSPRKNRSVGGVPLSWHIFGKAIDIEILPETPTNYQQLWGIVQNPKLLENPAYILKRDSSGILVIGSETKDINNNAIPDVFEQITQSGWLHLGE